MSGIYLRLMRARFDQKNDPVIDPVPWELDDKNTAYAYVEGQGYRTPRRVTTGSAQEALAAGLAMGKRFVVKQPNRHSTMGVYVLEEIADGRYLELFSLTEKIAADITHVGSAPTYWLAEECLPSGVDGRPIPLDYKIYAFRGQITHVVQIDRNVYPPRIAVFDGTFMPLAPGSDYTTDPNRWLHEHHVLPPHAGDLLDMAKDLSSSLNTRFVRIDTFDTPDGPVFGEFTFASGPDDVGMLVYSDRIFEVLDRAMEGEEVPDLSGFGAPPLTGTVLDGDPRVLARLAAGAIEGDTRYATSALPYVVDNSAKASTTLALAAIGFLNGDGSRAFAVQRILRDHRFSKSRLTEFVVPALSYHDDRARSGNQWHAARAAEIRLAEGSSDAVQRLRELAAAGSAHAAAVLAAHEKRAGAAAT